MAGAPAGPSRKQLYPLQWHRVLSFLAPRDVMAMRIAFGRKIRLLEADAKATQEELSDRARRHLFSTARLHFQQNLSGLRTLPGNDNIQLGQIYSSILVDFFSRNPKKFMSLSDPEKQLVFRSVKSFEPRFIPRRECFKADSALPFLMGFLFSTIHGSIAFSIHSLLTIPPLRRVLALSTALYLTLCLSVLYKRHCFRRELNVQNVCLSWFEKLNPDSKVLGKQQSLININRTSGFFCPLTTTVMAFYLRLLLVKLPRVKLPYEIPLVQDVADLPPDELLEVFKVFRHMNLRCQDVFSIGMNLFQLREDLPISFKRDLFRSLNAVRFDAANEFAYVLENKLIKLPYHRRKGRLVSVGIKLLMLVTLVCWAQLAFNTHGRFGVGMSIFTALLVGGIMLEQTNRFALYTKSMDYQALHKATLFVSGFHHFGAKARKVIVDFEMDRALTDTTITSVLKYAFCFSKRLYQRRQGTEQPLYADAV